MAKPRQRHLKCPRGWAEKIGDHGRIEWQRSVGYYEIVYYPRSFTGSVTPHLASPSSRSRGRSYGPQFKRCTFRLDKQGREFFSSGYEVTTAVIEAIDVLAERVCEFYYR